jgi:hypothetical protein
MGGSSRLAAGSFVARAASGMAAVGTRPPGHITEGAGFFAGHGRRTAVFLGLVVIALGFTLRTAPLPRRLIAGIATLCFSSLAGLLYVGFIFYPNIGIILVVAGCGAAFVAAISSFHNRQDLQQFTRSREEESAVA